MRNCSYNQRDFGLEDVKRTLRNIYAGNFARSFSHRKYVVSRGVTMHAQGDSSAVQRFNCSGYGHYRNDCPQHSEAKKRGPNRETPQWKNSRGGGSNGGRGGRGGSADGRGRGGGLNDALSTTPPATATKSVSSRRSTATPAAPISPTFTALTSHSPHQSESPVNITGRIYPR